MAICFLDVFLCLPSTLAGSSSNGTATCAGRFRLWSVRKNVPLNANV
jgi:hypothetical protein